jgi:WD40 repeat protein/serine/threonine protein kinase
MHIGDILNGTYQVERPLGVGGQARVWQARHLRLPRTFAIKECPLAGADQRELAERRTLFERERDILAALSHPGHPAIPKVSDFWEEPDQLFLVMDLVDGETLIELLNRRGRFTEAEVVTWGMQICEVLTYLHGWQPPIIYRDLSPDNVMLDRAGQLHLIDFGIARTYKPGQAQNTTSLGKAGYASPEHLSGGKSQTDVRSDIYTLGALLYHLLTGQEPVAVVDRLKQKANLQGGRVLLRPSTLNHKITQEMEACILKAMALEPDQRYQHAGEMQRALEAISFQAKQAQAAPSWTEQTMNPQRLRTRPVDPGSFNPGTSAPPATPPTRPQLPYPRGTEQSGPNPLFPRGPTSGPGMNRGAPPPSSGKLGPSPLRRGATGPAGSNPLLPSGPLPTHPASTNLPRNPLGYPEREQTGPGPAFRSPAGANDPQARGPTSGMGQRPPTSAAPHRGEDHLIISSGDSLLPLPTGRKPLPPAPVLLRHGPLLSRRRLLIGLGAVGVAAAGIGTATYFLTRSQALYAPLYTLSGDSLPVQCVAWSADGRRLASGGNNQVVKIWDASSGNLSLRLTGHTDFVQGVAWSSDGFYLASASADQKVFIWDALQGGAPQFTLTGHADTVYAVAWSPDGRMVASASADKTVRIWDSQRTSDTARVVLTGHTDSVYSVAWSPDGTLLLSASNDGTAKIWNAVQGGLALHSFSNRQGYLRDAVWSPDGQRLATAASTKVVTIWDANQDSPSDFALSGPNDVVTSLAWSADGTLLVAGSADHSITLWNPQQAGPAIARLSGHRDIVNAVAWSPATTMFASASSDDTVIIWQRQ